MKKIFVLIPLFILTVFIGCSQTSPQTTQPTPAADFIKFETVAHDFGKIATMETAPLILYSLIPARNLSCSKMCHLHVVALFRNGQRNLLPLVQKVPLR
jgi:hypothetical protein